MKMEVFYIILSYKFSEMFGRIGNSTLIQITVFVEKVKCPYVLQAPYFIMTCFPTSGTVDRASCLQQRLGFNPRSGHVKSVVDKVAPGWLSL
jgi:hypothetical protein